MIKLRNSLKGRLAAYFVLSIVISLLITGFLTVGLVQRYLRGRTISDLKYQSEQLASQIEANGLPQQRYINDLEGMYQTRAFIAPYGDQGISRLPQRGPAGDLVVPGGPLPNLDWNALGRGDTQVMETDLPGVERQMLVVAHGFKQDDQLAGAVVLAKPIRLFQTWTPLAFEFIIAAAVSLAVSLVISFILARRLSRPLDEITVAATAVAAGDFSARPEVRSEDEIGRLADAFRHMSDEVELAQQQQKEFVINVSHELKTPLTAIAGHIQALRDGVATDPESVAKSLSVIDSETKRLSRLIGDLLSLAKFDARQFELKTASVDPAGIVRAVADSFMHAAQERGVSLEAGDIPEGITLTTDPDRVRQVLSNLVQNALSHTPTGGKISLDARAGDKDLTMDVTDTGRGIDPDDLPHVFDRFWRGGGGGRGAGLGLGLSISRDLTRALGGDITVSSSPGEGSVFSVKLPLNH